MLQISNTTNEEFRFLEYEECKEEISSSSNDCDKGWKYLDGEQWMVDTTASMDCSGKYYE